MASFAVVFELCLVESAESEIDEIDRDEGFDVSSVEEDSYYRAKS